MDDDYDEERDYDDYFEDSLNLENLIDLVYKRQEKEFDKEIKLEDL